MARHPFTLRVIEAIKAIPPGKVATYGGIAELAGNMRAARQVSRILHSCSDMDNLPWHRVVNKEGKIALKPFQGYEEQRLLLENEGIIFQKDRINLEIYLWWPVWKKDRIHSPNKS